MAWKPPETDEVVGGWSPPETDTIVEPGPMDGAGKIGSLVKSDVPTPPIGESPASMVKRLFSATKEQFIPTSIDALKRLFTPQAGRFGVSRFLQEEGQKLQGAVGAATGNMEERIATSPLANVSPTLAAGVAAGAGTVGEIAKELPLTPAGAQEQLGSDILFSGLKLGSGKMKEAAVDYGRRALGYTKASLSSTKSAFETLRKQAMANKSAAMMLEKNAISKIGSTAKTADNALKILHESGAQLDNVINSLDNSGIRVNSSDLASDLIEGIKPKFDDEQKIVESLLSDIEKFPDGISLSEAKRVLKSRWGSLGYDTTVGTTGSKIYRKATDIIENKLSETVKQSAGSDVGVLYQMANETWGSALNALKQSGNKAAQEMGNNIFSLPTYVAAAGQLAGGNIPGALATAGVLESLRRRGSAVAANTLYSAGKGLESAPTAPMAIGLRYLFGRSQKDKK